MTPRRPRVPAVAAVLGLMLLAACGGGDDLGRPEDGQGSRPQALGHVHGLGADPGTGTLYAATHVGVFDLGEAGAGPARRVADRWQDTMAFTVAGTDNFLASGHPAADDSDRPAHLGLIESTDAAQTWVPVSLQGEADFHALEAAGELVYGYDSLTGRLLVSTDRRRWRVLDQVQVADLAADPADPTRVLASTPQGVVAYTSDGQAARQLQAAPPLVLLDWPTDDLLVGVAGDGTLYCSGDRGVSWRRTDGPAGDLQALEVTPQTWYVATSTGIYASVDDGRSWDPLTTR